MTNKILVLVLVIIVLTGGYYLINQPPPATDLNQSKTAATPTVGSLQPLELTIESGGFYFKPNFIKAKLGQKVTIHIDTKGVRHTFTITELGVDVQTPGGQITDVTFIASQKGSFVFYCAMAGHRDQGQWGTLTVE